MSTEYRVSVVIEKRKVSVPSPNNYLTEKKRSRWAKTGIGQVSVFSEELDVQMDLYDRLVEIVAEDNRERTHETREAIKKLLAESQGKDGVVI